MPVPGTVYQLGEASFTILSPTEEVEQQAAAAGDLNNLSVGLRLTFGANAFVMCGDAETLSEEAIVESGLILKADVLKLGPVSYTHLDVYKRQGRNTGKNNHNIGICSRKNIIRRPHKPEHRFAEYYRRYRHNHRNKQGQPGTCLLYTSRCV